MSKKQIFIMVTVVIIFILGLWAGLKYFNNLDFSDNDYTFSPPVLDDSESSPEKVRQGVQANNRFALNLLSWYQDQEKHQNKNIFFSPYSISMAMGMTYEGSRGRTAEQIESVFYFPEQDDVRRPAFAKIYNKLNQKNNKYKLRTANALWAQEDYQFLDNFFSTVENFYGGKVINLDFKAQPEQSRDTINNWVAQRTENKIDNLIPKGSITGMTRLILTNAIYFYGNWDAKFEKDNTKLENFQVNKDKTVKVDMMHMGHDKSGDENILYTEREDLKILEMPYQGKKLAMLVLLPKKDKSDVDQLISSLDTNKLEKWSNDLRKTGVDISFPKFKFKAKYKMKSTLAEMGMPIAFTGKANFSGMTDKKDLFIGQVYHNAFVKVNEQGTEATAATAVEMIETLNLGKKSHPSFVADHPFVFLIQEKDTDEILFAGKVINPNN